MSLHRLTCITLGVPNVDATADYYTEFGLTPTTAAGRPNTFHTVDGGEQLRIVAAPRRRLVELGVGVDDPDDLARIASSLAKLGVDVTKERNSIRAVDPGTQVSVQVELAPRVHSTPAPLLAYNTPGSVTRENSRSAAITREAAVRPRKLGHVVLGSTDQETSERFFTDGLGFKISDQIAGFAAFMRCSTDHHNVLIQQAPIDFMHHTSWQVDDVDEVGRGAMAMLSADPQRHAWGLGRHAIGSNFFWYLKDPAGNFSEYYSDMDCIVDDALWKPGVWEGMDGLYTWGPPPSASFLFPEDLAAMMTDSHTGGSV
jgi:catechol 2,3-dioxygenase-like lactoylglutathione lyase family enzyme